MMKTIALAIVISLASLAAPAYGKQSWTSSKGPVTGRLQVNNDPTGLCDTVRSEAGYFKIEGSKNKNYFYWFFESRNDPENDPQTTPRRPQKGAKRIEPMSRSNESNQ